MPSKGPQRYRPEYHERIDQWRARKWALGLCGNCGKRPLSVSQKTGREMLRCRICADRGNTQQQQARQAKRYRRAA